MGWSYITVALNLPIPSVYRGGNEEGNWINSVCT